MSSEARGVGPGTVKTLNARLRSEAVFWGKEGAMKGVGAGNREVRFLVECSVFALS